MKFKNYNEYDEDWEYEVGGYTKIRHKTSKDNYRPGKGHQSRHSKSAVWDIGEIPELDPISTTEPVTVTSPVDDDVPPTPIVVSTEIRESTNEPHIHTIKESVINFDRVVDIKRVEREFMGKTTYGIEFKFMGKSDLSRIAWFNINIQERDRVFEQENTYWKNLKTL